MNNEDITIENQDQQLARQSTGYQGEPQTQIQHSEPVFGSQPEKALQQMQKIVSSVAQICTGDKFIATIQGKKYPKVEWWTTVGASVGLFPTTKYSRRLDRDDEIAYESRVEVHHNGRVITSGEALCSSNEKNWKTRDEFAIKSMSITRATGKAYRTGLSMIAVMAGLEGTPAEEMPMPGEPSQQGSPPKAKQQSQPAQDSGTEKPWLNKTPKGSNEITDDWNAVMENIRSGQWGIGDVLDRYKVSKANRAELEDYHKEVNDGNLPFD